MPGFAVPAFRPWAWALMGILALALLAPLDAKAQSASDLFQKVFGAKAEPAAQSFKAPVKFLIYELGLAEVTVRGPADPILVSKADLREALAQVLVADALSVFDDIEAPEGTVSPAQLASAQITLTYDPVSVALGLDVPWDLLKVLDISLAPPRLKPPAPLRPKSISTVINLRGGVEVSWDETLPVQPPAAFTAQAEAAFRVFGPVLEAEADYRSDAEQSARLLRLRLFHDAVASRLRVQAGDITVATAGLQGAPRLVGVAAAREFDVQPERPFRPRGSRLVTLERPSVVDVLTGGRIIDTFSLAPGRYRITDLPLQVGANDFDLRITDDRDSRQLLRLALFFDPGLLGAGERDFGAALGFESRADDAYQSVDTERWAISGFHRQGITDALTLGAGVQAARSRLNLGGQIGVATRAGNLGMLAEWSRAGPEDGASAALQWDLPSLARRALGAEIDLGVTAGYTSRRYVGFSTDPAPDPRNDEAFDVAGRVSTVLNEAWGLNLTGRGAFERSGARESDFSFSVQRSFGTGVTMDLLSGLGVRAGAGEASLGLALSFAFGARHTADVSASWPDDIYRARWSRRPRRPVRDWSAGLGYTRAGQSDTVDLDSRFVDQRGEASLLVSATRAAPDAPEGGPRPTRGRASAALGFSLAGAGTSLGMGRPVTGSFALVRRHPGLSDTPIVVNPADDAYLARTDGLGPLVVPGLNDHALQQINLDAPDLAIGQDLGDARPFLRPAARSGLVVTAGTGASVILMARLVGADGAAYSLKAGTLTRLDGPAAGEEHSFFTNRDGQLAVDGITPGRYRVGLAILGHPQTDIEIAEDEAGIVRAGTLTLVPDGDIAP